jgi:hypothetical protein
VIVTRFDRESLQGFVQAPDGFKPGALELLTPEGNLLVVPFAEVKAVCFVRDFAVGETWRKHRAFLTRPKTTGLWVRIRFRDGDSLEGLLPNNLMLLEAGGFSLIPPDPTFQNQRVFVPREAATGVEVLGVIGTRSRRKSRPESEDGKQLKMFE